MPASGSRLMATSEPPRKEAWYSHRPGSGGEKRTCQTLPLAADDSAASPLAA